MTTISAKCIQASESLFSSSVAYSVEVRYPRFIHAEVMTHRDFSRNAASSRAIPILKMIRDIINDPAVPLHFGAHQKGMQADHELTGWRKWVVKTAWLTAMWLVIGLALVAYYAGVHKQVINRMLEPWSHITVIITSTKWNNFFNLRRHRDAEPHIHMLADAIYDAIQNADRMPIGEGEWHVPYVDRAVDMTGTLRYTIRDEDGSVVELTVDEARMVSAARCAATSYRTVDGKIMNYQRALVVGDKLIKADVIHASPLEHQLTPDRIKDGTWTSPHLHGNTTGFIQNRKLYPNESVPG